MPHQQSKNRLLPASLGFLLVLVVSATAVAQQTQSPWREIKFPFEETITCITFPTVDRGYFATSEGKIGISSDTGHRWDVYHITDAKALEAVYFRTKDSGLTVGKESGIYRTVDGGKNWEKRTFRDLGCVFTSVIWPTDSVALIVGMASDSSMKGVLYRSTDGAKYWTKQEMLGSGFNSLTKVAGVPLCFQSFGQLRYSQDLGRTWKTLETVNGKAGQAMAFYKQTGIICGPAGMCAYSSDRGSTWHPVIMPGNPSLTAVILVDERRGFMASADGSVFKTTDGGESWDLEPPLPEKTPLANLTVVAGRIFACGAGGTLFWKPLDK